MVYPEALHRPRLPHWEHEAGDRCWQGKETRPCGVRGSSLQVPRDRSKVMTIVGMRGNQDARHCGPVSSDDRVAVGVVW